MLLSQLAEKLGLELVGADVNITGANIPEKAEADEICHISDVKHAPALDNTRAGAVLVGEAFKDAVKASALVSKNVKVDWAKILTALSTAQGTETGVSDKASIHSTASVAATATIYPFVYVGAEATVEDGAVLFPGVYVGEKAHISAAAILYPNAVVMSECSIGRGCILHSGAVIGGDGYGFEQTEMGHIKVPQIGNVVLEDDVEVGCNSCIDRAALTETRIGANTKIDNLVQIGHNCNVGKSCLLVSQVGIAGSTDLGNGVVLAGQVGVKDHVTIGDGVMVGGQGGITRNVPAGAVLGGSPAIPIKEYFKAAATVPKLPSMAKQLRKLQKDVTRLQAMLDQKEE
ncbi:MAG: UDP-3-O-(3-hydroxymyristoyl)glucosamine N-acyltransferase [Desulfovibrio sp.]